MASKQSDKPNSSVSCSDKRAPLSVFDTNFSSESSSEELGTVTVSPINTLTTNVHEHHLTAINIDPPSGAEEKSLQSSEITPLRCLRRIKYAWVVVFGAFLVNFVQEGLQLSVSVLFNPFVEEFNTTKAETAWVPSIFLAMPHLGAPLASFFVNRFGCRTMTIVGAVLAALGVGISSLSSYLFMIFISYGVLGGFGISLMDVASNTILAQYYDTNLSFVSGIAVSGGGLGLIILMPLLDTLLDIYGWRQTNVICSGVYSLVCLCGLLFRPPTNKNPSVSSIKMNESVEEFGNCEKEKCFLFIPKHILEPFTCRGFMLFTFSNFILYLFYDLAYIYVPSDIMKTSSLLSIMGILGIFGQVFLGWLGDKQRLNPEIVYGVTMVITGISVGIIPLMKNPYSISATSACFGFFISGNYALTNIIIKGQILPHISLERNEKTKEKLLEQKFTHSYGLLSFVQGIGNFIGPPMAGWLVDLYDAANYAFYIGGIGIILSGLIMFILPIHDHLKKTSQNTPKNNCEAQPSENYE